MKYIVSHIKCRLKTYWFAILRKYFRRSRLHLCLLLLEFLAFSSEWSLRVKKQWNETCDDIISSSFFFISFQFLLLFSPISSTQSVMAFTIRYMAWKNLIQFWVSSHFSDSVCFSTSTSSSSRSLSHPSATLWLLLLVLCGWMHLNSFYSCVATFTIKKWERERETNNFILFFLQRDGGFETRRL